MKRATIEAQFLDVKGCPTLVGSGKGSSSRAAISSALRQLVKSEQLKHKRWSQITANITVITINEPVKPVKESSTEFIDYKES